MKYFLPLWFLLVASSLVKPTHAQDITLLHADREVELDFFLYDSFWRESDRKVVFEAAEGFGPFDESLDDDFNTLYQFTHGEAVHDSDISPQRVLATFEMFSTAIDYDAGEATVAGTADLDLLFNVEVPVRYRIYGEMSSFFDSTEGDTFTSIYLASGPEILFSLTNGRNTSTDATGTGWLKPGIYQLDAFALADVTADQYSNPHNHNEPWQEAQSDLILDFQTFCPGDFNFDGVVDVNDWNQYLAAWQAGNLDADVDNNGVVDMTDRLLFGQALNLGC